MAHPLLELKDYLSSKELKERYLKSTDAVERSHWQILWLVGRKADRMKPQEASEVTGFSPDWIRKLMRRYNKEGPNGIFDKRKNNGNEPILSEAAQMELNEKIQKSPEDGGLWTGPKVAQWISKKLNCKVHAATGWRYLQRLGFSLRVPRPEHKKSATAQEQEAFKKNSKKEWQV